MKKRSKILDAQGNPIEWEAMEDEVSRPSVVSVRQPWLVDSAANGLHPHRLANILQAANEGSDYDLLTLAEEVEEREIRYGADLRTRRLAVTGLQIQVEAGGESAQDKKMAEAVRGQTLRPVFKKLVADLLDGLGKGRSTCEIIWQTGQAWQPEQFIWRDPRYFKYHPERPYELRLIDDKDAYNGLALPPFKFVTHAPVLKTGLPVRNGLTRMVAVNYMCKSYTLKDWMTFVELYGMPMRVGRYGPNVKDDDMDALRWALRNLGSDAAGMIPESMRIEFIERTAGAGSGHQLFKELAEWLDRQTSIAVLGQTATTEGTAGKLGNEEAQQEVRHDIKVADAGDVSDTINRDFVKPFIDLNFGVQQAYPRVVLYVPNPENLEVLTSALGTLLPFGLRVKQSQIRDKFGLDDPEEGDELLAAASGQPAAQPEPTRQAANRQAAYPACPNCGTAHNRSQHPEPDAIDEIAAEELAEWQEQMEPIMDPVRRLVEQSDNYQAFLAGLPGLLNDMDDTALIQHLAKAAFIARGLGDAEA